jgi:acyl carrier protein
VLTKEDVPMLDLDRSVAAEVAAIIAAQALTDPADVTPERTLASLGLDSLGLVETIFAVEEAFDIQVPFNANDPGASGLDASTVGGIIAAVERLVAARGV